MTGNNFNRDFIAGLLATRRAEALEWLNAGSAGSLRNIGEIETTQKSIAFIKQIYSLGAKQVLAVDIIQWEQGENTGDLLVALPEDKLARGKLFAFEKLHAESMGFDATPDEGQAYFYLKLD